MNTRFVPDNEESSTRTVNGFILESDVPVPPRSGGGRETKYPFAAMQVGDSFHAEVRAATLRSACAQFTKREDVQAKFVVRTENDDNDSKKPGARCWRVAPEPAKA